MAKKKYSKLSEFMYHSVGSMLGKDVTTDQMIEGLNLPVARH